jgi:uncharacterized protein (DUF1697 family)
MRYVAFLRAINIGGHVVKMAELKKLFEEMGFKSVETFIASGNVIFETTKTDAARLEARIEKQLQKSLGYEVATFVRSEEEIAALANESPFTDEAVSRSRTYNVAFTKSNLGDGHREKVKVYNSDVSDFVARGREVHWLCKVMQSESNFVSARFEKELALKATWRNINTVRRIAAKYPPTSSTQKRRPPGPEKGK